MIELWLSTDWPLLRQQKATLLSTALKQPADEQLHLKGIVHFLDAIQALAVSSGLVSEEDVFGEKDVYES